MPASLNVYTKSLFLLAGILFPDIINAQSGSIFHHLTAEQGLASNRCNSILQDSEGYYWIATDDGLSRFDGTHCKNYRKNANDSLSLSNNLSYNLLEDKQGNIWIGTYQGINRYNKKTGKFTRYYLSHPGISPGYNNIVRSVDMDKEGNIWVAAGGLWCFNVSLQEWTLFENSKEDNYSIPAGTVIQVAFDRQLNGIWALAGQRFAFYNIRQKKFYSTPEHTQQSKLFEYTGIINFTIEEGKGIWFSTHQENGGLFFYDSRLNSINKKMLLEGKGLRKMSLDNNGKLWLHFFARKTLILDTKTNSIDSSFLSNVHDQSALSEESNNLYIDKAGCYWIGSPTGINIYNPAIQAIAITSFLDGNEIGHKKFEIRDIVQKDSFSYFVATTLGIFSYIPGQQLSLRKLPFAGELHTDKLFLTTDDILWYAAEGKIYCYDLTRKRLSKTLTVESKVQSIINGNNGLIYVATWTKGLYVFDREGILKEHLTAAVGEKLIYDWIICAVLSRNKKYIWIGYNGGKGFSKFCISDGSVSHYTVNVSLPESRAANTINYITENEDGSVWLSTYGGGLLLYNTATNSFKSYTSNNGLQSDFIFQTEMDNHQNLWISTPTEIFFKPAGKEDITRTGIQLPDLNNDVLQNIFRGPKGNFIFFRKDKLVEIQADNFFNSEYPSKILLTSVKAGQQDVIIDNMVDNNIEVNYFENDISIEFSLLRPNTEAKPVYAYWLKGADKSWINADNRNFVYYANLVPGKYKFIARAVDPKSGKTYYSKQIDITIFPPWWQTLWFSVLLLVLFILLLFVGIRLIVRSKLRRQKEKLEKQMAIQSERERITADLHDDVGATLSSMHIYGDLASNAWDTQPQQSKEMVGKISAQSKELMARMSDIVWSLKSPGEEKNSFTLRLKNYTQDLLAGKGIAVNFVIDEKVTAQIINPLVRKNILLIAKEAINNIAKYSDATAAAISLQQQEEEMLLIVSDNGKGFDKAKAGNGNGLGNIEQRCRQLNGHCSIDTTIGQGVKILCRFPIAIISHTG
ncbi:MAG: two-component regulator propeller domain-containing protein [Chitinophagaceae bacterium]